jgi:hypothetical protein
LQRDRGKNNIVLILNSSTNTNTKTITITTITTTRDESGLGEFADDGAFALGSRRYIEEEAWALYEPCDNNDCGGYDAAYGRQDCCGVLWGSQWSTCAGFCPMRRSPRTKMADGEAPVGSSPGTNNSSHNSNHNSNHKQ